jgi:hypothetical protein
LKKKYQNNYILQRNDTSKENFRKVEKTGNDGTDIVAVSLRVNRLNDIFLDVASDANLFIS